MADAIRDDEWLEDGDENVKRLQWSLSRRLGWPAPLRFLELGASLADATGAIARHAAAARLRLEQPDHLLWTGDDDAERIAGFFRDHGPIMIRGAESTVLGQSSEGMLNRLLGYALSQLTWMTMREGHFRAEDLVPPALDFTDVFDNIRSRSEYLALLRESLPFLTDASFRPAAELLEGD